jgi:hypothetical protein
MEEVKDYAYLLWRSFKAAWNDPTSVGTYLVIATIIMIAVGLGYMLISAARRRKKRAAARIRQYIRMMKGKRMSPQEREEYERFLIEDFITTGLEEMYFLGQITKERRDWWYDYFAQRVKLNGLVRSVRKGAKEAIKRRIRSDLYNNVIPFPDPAPAPTPAKVGKLSSGKLFGRKKTVA